MGRQSLVHLDTHVVLWLHAGTTAKLAPILDVLQTHELQVSPMVRLELHLLHEIGRVLTPPDLLLGRLASEFGVAESTPSMPALVSAAAELSWTRDPFDRLIVANAIVDGARLITKDQHIRKHFKQAVWRVR